jgi:hypothetical protein
VVLELDVNFLRLGAICPVEVAGLEGVYFEHAFFFAFCLDDLDRHMGFVDYHVSGFEFDDLREAEWVR